MQPHSVLQWFYYLVFPKVHLLNRKIGAVVPLPGNKSIPVSMPAMTGINQEQIQIFDQQMSKLDELIKETRTNNQLTQKMLKIAQG